MEFDKRIGNARIKSTKQHIKISYQGDTINLSKRKLKKFFVKAATFCILINLVGQALDTTVENVNYLFDVVSVRTEESKDAEQILLAYNLNTEPNENGDWGNDYSVIKNISREDVYGLLNYCGYAETENVLKSLGYSSWNNYLEKNGYYDSTGRPNLGVWENYVESELVAERNGAKQNDRSY